jgi:hypothetical protein
MQHFRRAKLRHLIADRFSGSREKFMAETGLNKSRLSQLMSDSYPFGERAARELALRLQLPEDYFETMDERTAQLAMRFNQLPEPIKAKWEAIVAMLGDEAPNP